MNMDPFTLRDAIESVVGFQIADIDREFVDLHNDLRVATVREIRDLGISKEKAELVLFLCNAYDNGKNPKEALEECELPN